MNKITKRIVAGASAVALLVSAVGVDQFADLFMKTSFAAYKSKVAKSTGFGNLEQDTDGDYYNTGYGLHTNKTASEVKDGTGRTFDVNLESWYVGENPVDVATILDASGSMAWTVNTLEPLEIVDDVKLFEDFKDKYNIQDTDLSAYDYKSEKLRLLAAIQDKNEGYLPQEVVDCILDPTKTDNSKLSYAGYRYYVYEARSSVSEFVPLGYWDGGADPLTNSNLIGYYPFNGNLQNKAPKVTDKSATYIEHAEDTGNTFDEKSVPIVTVEPTFTGDDLQLDKTAENGALLSDVKATESFTISMRVKSTVYQGSTKDKEELPFVYIGNETDYIQLTRSGTDSRRIKINVKNASALNSDTTAFNSSKGDWKNISLVYDGTTLKVIVWDNNQTTATATYTLEYKFEPTGMNIIIGGDINKDDDSKDYIDMSLTDFCVFNKALSDAELKTLNGKTGSTQNIKQPDKLDFSDSLTAYYDFDDGKLDNKVAGSSSSLKFIEQAEGATFSGKEIASGPAEPVYSSDNYSGGHSLNVSQTAKLGSVLLDAHPTSKKYTLTFAIKKNKDSTNDNNNFEHNAEIMYIGSSNLDDKDYYSIKRHNHTLSSSTDNRHLRFYKGDKSFGNADISDVFQSNNDNIKWSYITYVFDDGKLRVYKDGEKAPNPSSGSIEELECAPLTTETINFIIAGLKDEYDGSDILLDDLYVFDNALTETEVSLYFGSGIQCKADEDGKKTHARTIITKKDGTQEIIDIAQISNDTNRLAQNPNAEERRGWYYVNSASDWADIEGCLKSGKQYIGIYTDKNIDSYKDGVMKNDTATKPTGYDEGDKNLESIQYGDTNAEKYTAPTTERSIRFYVDDQKHLRCFVWSGADSKLDDTNTDGVDESDPRTFCSVVYEKKDKQQTKYEQLNEALNQFYTALAENSDLTNSAIVRFSTNNAANNLEKLILKDWTNWSDAYTKDSLRDKELYLHNLLIPDEGETSVPPDGSTEYPYVMTGGTYTWTGLKSFYDNMVDTTDKSSGDRVYDVANDARDKYLIIFTDGRDNTQDNTVDSEGNLVEGSTYGATKHVNDNKPEGSTITKDGELAKAWADKLKEEGYTIYCVMMATGSISPDANKNEYDRAKNFLTTLAGSKEAEDKLKELQEEAERQEAEDGSVDPKLLDQINELKQDPANHVIVANTTSSGDTDTTVVAAFQNILKQIQQPRNDYTVQDYIDPRFDLVDVNDNVYHLGAGGNITIEKTDGTTETRKVGNIIDHIDDGTTVTGLAYTPRESYMVNRVPDPKGGYTTGDDVGTGYIYYDDVKDMYYLRWTDQIIPMENKAFDTEVDKSDTYLDVWSATIRLKAKDDFIGGNNILTNGNEAGENLVFSEATIENMDKDDNYKLYGFEDTDLVEVEGTKKVPYRKKLEALSGTNRKINAVDADGVSQAVYGDGIDIPSSGFPRTTVNVKLLPLNANDLNDVIYMGEVVSPTMMLADLENGYMTGSYYLQYLERYAYRVYGEEADNMPLIELLNKWLKINDKEEASKTFTIPYIYLPDPEYGDDGKLNKNSDGKVVIQNSTGASWAGNNIDFADLNLRDVTGFITYTWKRDDDSKEPQQLMTKGTTPEEDKYDITKDYVVKNTNQIKYNLQLKFTPLKDVNLPADFQFDDIFIKGEGAETGDKFFAIDTTSSKNDDTFYEFIDEDADHNAFEEWSISFNRTDYLKAMISETKTYEPHVMYNGTKWVLVNKDSTGYAPDNAVTAYINDEQTIVSIDDPNKVTDKGVYDWDSSYKEAVGNVQLEGDKLNDYTGNTKNVGFAGSDGKTITDKTGQFIAGKSATDVYSLVANTTYIKDVVNAALALELFVDGKYLNNSDPKIKTGKTFTFEATRYYDDPYDPLPYDKTNALIGADTGAVDPSTNKVAGKKYQLTFTVDDSTLPTTAVSNEIYRLWATLTKVEVFDGTKYVNITEEATTDNPYLGYNDLTALPIGTYEISVNDDLLQADETASQFYLGKDESNSNVYFQYLKIDNDTSSYTYNRFPHSVYTESDTAATSTGDGEYFIKDGSTDNSKKNIAENSRTKDSDTKTQTATFYFGTVESREINGKELSNTKGVSGIVDKKNDYAKDRLGIIMLSADNNSLAITKEVTNYKTNTDLTREWYFTVTVTPEEGDAATEFASKATEGFDLKWYTLDTKGDWQLETSTSGGHTAKIIFTNAGDGTYTAKIKLKHGEKVVISGLQEGTWKVTENVDDFFGTPHNNANGFGEDEWRYQFSNETNVNTLNPISQVDYINEFPYELPSAGGSGIVRYIFFGTALMAVGVLLFAVLYYDRRKKARK